MLLVCSALLMLTVYSYYCLFVLVEVVPLWVCLAFAVIALVWIISFHIDY